MKFVKYDGEIHAVKRIEQKNLKGFFEEFMSANIEIAVIDWNERDYKSPVVLAQVVRNAAKIHGYPITVTKRGDSVYLIRRDM